MVVVLSRVSRSLSEHANSYTPVKVAVAGRDGGLLHVQVHSLPFSVRGAAPRAARLVYWIHSWTCFVFYHKIHTAGIMNIPKEGEPTICASGRCRDEAIESVVQCASITAMVLVIRSW